MAKSGFVPAWMKIPSSDVCATDELFIYLFLLFCFYLEKFTKSKI